VEKYDEQKAAALKKFHSGSEILDMIRNHNDKELACRKEFKKEKQQLIAEQIRQHDKVAWTD
jgi:hypothetical protein